ncbi:MAG TPA: ribbon-helix-helix protein, CopG family, partial [Tepidisphaeraceae bacterium]|nr:ribbon-helix-helix protein, CopG family [Tepidisphaeraceae bacterium]
MRVVAISIEDESFTELDAAARAAGLSPTEFVRRAAASAVRLQKSRPPPPRREKSDRAQPVG